MNRRSFLGNSLLATVSSLSDFPQLHGSQATAQPPARLQSLSASEIEGFTLLCIFQSNGVAWRALEDFRTRDGSIALVGADGRGLLLRKKTEACFATANPPYLGLSIKDIGLSGPDLLADKLLAHGGDPDPNRVRDAAPPLESLHASNRDIYGSRMPWNTFVGTRQCSDTMPVFPQGNTRTYHPVQFFEELHALDPHARYEGLLGGWMPGVRKVFPAGPNAYYEVIVFGDVAANDRFIVQTWHRTAHIENGRITRVEYGYSYPPYPPSRVAPAAEQFYAGLLLFATAWIADTAELETLHLPDLALIDMTRHAFARELVTRPTGVYPKYGAVDRDYYGSEYDGFQDIFTSSLFANLAWGRFAMARDVLDNYFTAFVDDRGNVNMRGPETAQFGLTLELLARYWRYTHDATTLRKHRQKIEGTVSLLIGLHDESLRLDHANPGYGLIAGWNESDSSLFPDPSIWWKPYYANSAFAARGLLELSEVWPEMMAAPAPAAWAQRGAQLRDAVAHSVARNIRRDMQPPYLGTYPGAESTFRKAMQAAAAAKTFSPQQWPHRAYAELLQADMLPAADAALVIDCMRAYGATSIGVVANVGRPDPDDRPILGFISYGYAQMLLRLDRIEEYLLFSYAHRFHDHNRGSWTAGEVAPLDGSAALFCIPAQLTTPVLSRWMLVAEFAAPGATGKDAELYLGRAIPRDWFASEQRISVQALPTQWGPVSYETKLQQAHRQAHARVVLPGNIPRVHVRFRLPEGLRASQAQVNGKSTALSGKLRDTVLIEQASGVLDITVLLA